MLELKISKKTLFNLN